MMLNTCVVKVKGKLNSITLDSCKKTDIVFDALVAQIETINCKSVKIQVCHLMRLRIDLSKDNGFTLSDFF